MEDGERTAYDRSAKVESLLAWLERGGIGAIPTRILPPIDAGDLQAARQLAIDTAIQTGRMVELKSYRQQIIDWALVVFRRYGLYPVYFTGYWSSAAARSEAIEVLIDVMTAYLLWDVLPDEITTTLWTQFDVLHGGPIFAAPGSGSGDD